MYVEYNVCMPYIFNYKMYYERLYVIIETIHYIILRRILIGII